MKRAFVVFGVAALVVPAARTPATPAPSLRFFLGGLHTHTGYSDGAPATAPSDAYARARDTEHLDFFAVTEHSEALDVPVTLSEACLPHEGGTVVECALSDPDPGSAALKWEAQRRHTVAEARPGSFAALRGFEWSSDVHGHINVYFSRNYTQWVRDGGNASLAGFYQWLRTPPRLGGGADGLATFNHPGSKTLCGQTGLDEVSPETCAADPTANWNDFAFVPDLDERIVGIEMFNRRSTYEPEVFRALDKGWHLGLVGAEDIHETNWGSPAYAKTVVLASTLTPAALKDALRARRVQATLDPSIRISFTAAGRPMGTRLRTSAGTVPLEVSVDGGSVGRVDLVTNTGAVAASASGRTLAFDAPAIPSERWYLVRVVEPGGRRVAYSSPVWIARRPPPAARERPFEPRWVAGDLHVHTTWSHDSLGGPYDDEINPDEFYTLGWETGDQLAIAESRGLDFLAITDHNDTRSAIDPGFTSDRLTLLPGYESSLAGHAQIVNVSSCVSAAGLVSAATGCPRPGGREGVRALAAAVRSLGGLFQINHPSDGDWLGTFGDGSDPDPIVPDSVEVWNIGPWHYQPPFPAANDNDFSLRFWETFLNAGHRVAATGGSDNHWRSTTAVQGVGQPTTWVYVTTPGPDGIVDGIRAGRTTISHQPPGLGGPRLELVADDDGDGRYESMVGDTIGPAARLTARIHNAPPGWVLSVVSDTGTAQIVATGSFAFGVPAGARWIRAELRRPDARAERASLCEPLLGGGTSYCRNRLVVEALTSPIYVTG